MNKHILCQSCPPFYNMCKHRCSYPFSYNICTYARRTWNWRQKQQRRRRRRRCWWWCRLIIHRITWTQDFTLDFYFRQFWTDPRLAYQKRPGVETLSVGSDFIKNIWVPDTFFVNEKQSYFHFATTSNEFIRVHHSGSITRSIR